MCSNLGNMHLQNSCYVTQRFFPSLQQDPETQKHRNSDAQALQAVHVKGRVGMIATFFRCYEHVAVHSFYNSLQVA